MAVDVQEEDVRFQCIESNVGCARAMLKGDDWEGVLKVIEAIVGLLDLIKTDLET